MGLRIDIYRSDYDSICNAFVGRRSVTVVNVDGPFDPTPDAPAAFLDRNGRGDPVLVPVIRPDMPPGPPPMAGGTYAGSSDSRWRAATGFYGAIPIHDRYETWADYERMSR